jgi:hypothetical protein
VREQGKNDEPAQSQEAGRKEEGPVEPAVRVAENIHVVREGVADLRDQRCSEPINSRSRHATVGDDTRRMISPQSRRKAGVAEGSVPSVAFSRIFNA